MQTPESAVTTWWATATPRSRRRALDLAPAEAVPGWLADELTRGGVALTMALFTEGPRITRRYVQSPELRAHLAAERSAVSAA
ncbi:hypothetical protein GTR02_13385 [Kineococcus sp. R8]|uniref:hypothetical protein n=1 Tax=Kineococcus siccus TaxID=2696567 RepID=UPI0014123F3F|nr:hypothetical protein [Kineococcus siccus]NAZ82811.1 hypothetical protein [Kineococcus siccus]